MEKSVPTHITANRGRTRDPAGEPTETRTRPTKKPSTCNITTIAIDAV
jgi:hypothetical protein